MHDNEKRLKAIGLLHKHGAIKTFADIWKNIPKSSVANEMGIGHGRFNRLIASPANFTYNEVNEMAKMFGMKYRDLAIMVEATLK